MLHQLIHPHVIYAAMFFGYILILFLIYPFANVAKLKPNPPKSSTVRVELTISTPAPARADPRKSKGTCITTTFVFADELARTVTGFLAGFNSPSRSDLSELLQQANGPIGCLFITRQEDNHIRSMTLLGEDAEKVSSFLTHCFNCQLAAGTDEFQNETVSRTA
jgi:hypothetical protein